MSASRKWQDDLPKAKEEPVKAETAAAPTDVKGLHDRASVSSYKVQVLIEKELNKANPDAPTLNDLSEALWYLREVVNAVPDLPA